ncbi:MAG: LamG domain-containing protein [Gammaproteobacteria bacterium]|nr:LamG domain-containing protein [Gammaproteobacteria bacterium]
MDRGKGGISTVIAAILIIVITLAGVMIVWSIIIPIAQQNLAFSELDGRVSVISSGGYTLYDADKGLAMVQVKRNFDEGVMDRIRIVFSVNGSSYGSSVPAPESGLTRIYTFNLSGYGKPMSVSVIPIFVVGNMEREGSVTSEEEILSGRISKVSTVIYELESDYTNEIPTIGIVSWWKFEGDATDSSGNGNDGTVVGATWSSLGKHGGAYEFDGINDYIEVPHHDAFPIHTGTINFWFQANVLDLDQTLLSKDSNDFDTGGHFTISFTSDNEIEVRIQDTASSYTLTSSSGLFQSSGEWHNIAATFSSNGLKLYVDGDLKAQDPYSGGLAGNFEPLAIGASTTTSGDLIITPLGEYFNGAIDEIIIYDRVLSRGEIISIYKFR